MLGRCIFFVFLLGYFHSVHGICRNSFGARYVRCGDAPNISQRDCEVLKVKSEPCCYMPDKQLCMVNSNAISRHLRPEEFRRYIGNTYTPGPPDPAVGRNALTSLGAANPQDQQRALGNTVNLFRRSLTGGVALLGLLSGTSLTDLLFPKCPVHVKLCYRVPCGGFLNKNLDGDPNECLRDPTCCYDYELGFLKSIFGRAFMGGAPVCYFGPTSRQWRYVTNFFQPWNPYYTRFILDAFAPIFNTKAFNIGGQLLCQFNLLKKNYPVGSKSELECNLVSGCWDASKPPGKQCLMASSLIGQLFNPLGVRDEAIYPSLYTNDRSDTVCASNWFDYGPKAYRRMECDVGAEPSSIVDKITKWCPINDCCLNYAVFSASQLGQIALINSFGGGGNAFPLGLPTLGGFPGIQLGVPGFPSIFGNSFSSGGQLSTPLNANILYLLSASGSSFDLEDLFCPYRNIFPSLFDLSDVTDGCCDIPKCYHKKRYVGGSPAPTSPPTILPPVYQGTWGSWGPCSVQCGTGQRYRSCFYSNGNAAPNSQCFGQESENCALSPCQAPSNYNWGPYGSWSQCGATCGPATRTKSRQCYDYQGRPASPSFCPGRRIETGNCPTPPCPVPVVYSWAPYGSWTQCSATCGPATHSRTRRCYDGQGRPVNPNNCPGQETQSQNCALPPCPAPIFYNWGPYGSWTQCSATCGPATRSRTRRCYDGQGRPVSSSNCPGQGTQSQNCALPPCPAPIFYNWGPYGSWTQCSATCGSATRSRSRRCYDNRGRWVRPRNCPEQRTQNRSCALSPCFAPTLYNWGQWGPNGPCSSTCNPSFRYRTRQCYDGQGNPSNSNFCSGQGNQTVNCNAPPCSQRYVWTELYYVMETCNSQCRKVLGKACRDTQSPGRVYVMPSFCTPPQELQTVNCDVPCFSG